MALSIQDTLGNIELPTAYVKITGVQITETGSNESGKLYQVNVVVNFFSDSTKEFSYKQLSFVFNDVQTSSFTVGGMYDLLKTKEEFSSALDI